MSKKIILILFILLLSNPAFADEAGLDVFIRILTYKYPDAFVVGDSFYYKINLTNKMADEVSDNFSISIYNPKGGLIGSTRIYERSIKPGENIEIIAKGGKGNETAAFPFDIRGDYKLILNSTNLFDFYRWFKVKSERYIHNRYIRSSGKFDYNFDVMPKWQYELWKQEEEINKQTLDVNKKMLDLTIDLNSATRNMNDATQKIKFATYIMLGVALLTLLVAFIKR